MVDLKAEQEPRFRKTLRWHDGFVLALPIATGVFVSVGFTIGAIGALPAILISGGLAIVALLQNFLFAEMASMFPEKAGGVALYVTESWRRYSAPIGPLVAFGYWCGWAPVLALIGLTLGSLVQAEWFPDATWTLFSTAGVNIGLPHVIGAGAAIACTLLNIFGIRLAVHFSRIIGAIFAVVLLVLAVGPFLTGDWNAGRLTSHVDGGWTTVVVWIYVSAWAIYGTELCAAFAPEYQDTARDTSRALVSSALFMVLAYSMVPLASAGSLGEQTIAENPITYGVLSFQKTLGGASGVVTAVLCGALFLGMISALADAGRALCGIAREDMTIRQFGQLNRHGVPGRALIFALIVNLIILALVGNPVAILIASNVGYILAITLAVLGFLLLRKDRPMWPRPIRLGRVWIAVAVVVASFNIVILAVGATNPGLSYAGGPKDVLIGLALLSLGLVLFAYRRMVQDRGRLHAPQPSDHA